MPVYVSAYGTGVTDDEGGGAPFLTGWGSNDHAIVMGLSTADWFYESSPNADITQSGFTVSCKVSNLGGDDPYLLLEPTDGVWMYPVHVRWTWSLNGGPVADSSPFPPTFVYGTAQVNFHFAETDLIGGLSPICMGHRVGIYSGYGTAAGPHLYSNGWDTIYGNGDYDVWTQNYEQGPSGGFGNPLLQNFWDQSLTTELYATRESAYMRTYFTGDAVPAWQDYVRHTPTTLGNAMHIQQIGLQIYSMGGTVGDAYFNLTNFEMLRHGGIAPNDKFLRTTSNGWGTGALGTWEKPIGADIPPDVFNTYETVIVGTGGSTFGTGGNSDGALGIAKSYANSAQDSTDRIIGVDLGFDLLAKCAEIGGPIDILARMYIDWPVEPAPDSSGDAFLFGLTDTLDGDLFDRSAVIWVNHNGKTVTELDLEIINPGHDYFVARTGTGTNLVANSFWVLLHIDTDVFAGTIYQETWRPSEFTPISGSGLFATNIPSVNWGTTDFRYLVFDHIYYPNSGVVISVDQIRVMYPADTASSGVPTGGGSEYGPLGSANAS